MEARKLTTFSRISTELLLSNLTKLEGLKDIEKLVTKKLSSDAELLTTISEYLLKLGGKRIRPILVLLVSRALGLSRPNQQLIDVAAGIELIHMATLLHDDIVDHSPVRRHAPTAYKKFGLENTLLCGDFLLVRAFGLCAHLDRIIIDETERSCVELTEGEILETKLSDNPHDLQSSITIARKKTAGLFRLAALSAAHIVTKSEKVTAHFADFGEKLGIAFQIIDDILDVTSTEEVLGKQAGIDLRERKPSAINVLWLQSSSELAKELLSTKNIDDFYVAAAIKELNSGPVITQAKDLALQYTNLAITALECAVNASGNTDADAVETLRALVDYALDRIH